ncbi:MULTISPECIES: hypothetical protein [Francisella]|uniref:Uncharacterized protein n=1 Tax=Francisella marina TaxID=2249302 RepID=A0ABX5ZEX4_9GAMM|nr:MULTISPECIES: hypothetical protein [Francisella]QEO56591.1 hypothetical protein F0R74_01560 [Francisella marina]QEO59290.1 hypothetical protein F0R75_05665 [Francisella marina]
MKNYGISIVLFIITCSTCFALKNGVLTNTGRCELLEYSYGTENIKYNISCTFPTTHIRLRELPTFYTTSSINLSECKAAGGIPYQEYGNLKCGTQSDLDQATINNQRYIDAVELVNSPSGSWGGVSGSSPGRCDWAYISLTGNPGDRYGGFVSARCPHPNGVHDTTYMYLEGCDPTKGLHNNHAHLVCSCKSGYTRKWVGSYTHACIK